MIQQNIVQATLCLSSQIADKGLTLVPSPNTILSELVGLSVPYITDYSQSTNPSESAESNTSLLNMATAVQLHTAGSLENPSRHTLEMDGLIKDLSKIVSTHINIAKTVVNP